MVFEGLSGKEYSFKANGMESSEKFRLGGRPIGFRVWSGTGGIQNQPLKMSIAYNECNCPASKFMKNAPPKDMKIEAVVGDPVT